MTKHSTTEVVHQQFPIKFDYNENELSGVSSDDYLHFEENVFSDSNDILESDENGYDSDCSLGSMNSVFLRLTKTSTSVNKINKVDTTQSNYDNNSNEGDQTRKNSIACTRIPSSENTKYPIKKIDVVSFYGKQQHTQQNNTVFRKQTFVHRLKMKYTNSKLLERNSLKNKFKRNMNNLRISLKSRYQKYLAVKRMTSTKSINQKDEKLIRNKLQIHIPLLQSNYKVVKMIEQNNKMYSSIAVKTLLHNEITCITNSLNPLSINDLFSDYNDTENIISELNTFNVDDFMDEDDFEDPRITDLVEKLLKKSDVFTENKMNCQWNLNEDMGFEQT